MNLRYAWNTNGCAHHRLAEAITLIADHGYDGVALTLDHQHCDPFASTWREDARRLAAELHARGLACVVETGARFLLDPRRKHEPTLISAEREGRARRVAFLQRAIDIAAILEAEAVSFWAGVRRPEIDRDAAWSWLLAGVHDVLAHARSAGVVAALEPEPGMLVETVADWAALGIDDLPLALDTGHCLVTGEGTPDDAIRAHAARLGTVSIEDMRRGVHLHLPFGEGDMDVPAVLGALRDTGFARLVCVELSRESARADIAIPEAIAALRAHEAALP